MLSTDEGVSAKELLRRGRSPAYSPIPTFVQALDIALGGGIKPGMITELVGDSGIGKTTFCIQLCIDVQIPQILQGPEGEALFIDTENTFMAIRARDMVRGFVIHCRCVTPQEGEARTIVRERLSEESVLSKIHVLKCKNLSNLEKVVLGIEDFVRRNRKIRLIVIDSIAYPFYTKEEGFFGRTQAAISMGQVLHYLAGRYDLAVVVTNNMTTRFDPIGRDYLVPFMGDMWSHVPNQRIHFQFKDGTRKAKIVKSSSVPEAEVEFKVTGVGIRDSHL